MKPHPARRRIAPPLAATLAATLACPAQPATGEEDPVRAILFGSMEAGASTFVTTGAKIALDDVNREGFAALVSVGTGARLERASAPPGWVAPTLVRTSLLASALAGYQFFRDWGVVAVFAGPEGSVEALTGSEGVFLEPARYGARLHGELWARPSTGTLVTATAIAGTARGDLYARVSAGYRLWGAYLGPEAGGYGDSTGYRKCGIMQQPHLKALHTAQRVDAMIGPCPTASAAPEPTAMSIPSPVC